MNVIALKTLEDCFDGSFIKELLLNEPVTKELIFHLAKEGTLEYFPTFARPFYKVTVQSKYTMKGVEGNVTMRLLLSKNDIEKNQSKVIEILNDFKTP